jgi:ankyrin repeat protein
MTLVKTKEAYLDNVKEIERLLKKGVDPNIVGKKGRSFAVQGVLVGRIEEAELFFAYNGDGNLQDKEGMTVAMHAAKKSYNPRMLKVVEMSLQNGADPNVQDNQGMTFAMYALFSDTKESVRMVELYWLYGGNLTLKNIFGNNVNSIALGEEHSLYGKGILGGEWPQQ